MDKYVILFVCVSGELTDVPKSPTQYSLSILISICCEFNTHRA